MVLGTLVDLIETLKSSNSRLSINSTNSTAAATRASTGALRSSSCRCFGSEPELTPIRIGTPFSFALTATSATFSRPPMLPGLRRMQWAPASIALRARVWLKWMSAITGIGDSSTIVFSASTSSSRGTAQRTRSAPASATLRICSIVAARLAVSVLVIVCTATGAPPPIGTPPTNICRLDAISRAYRGGLSTRFEPGGPPDRMQQGMGIPRRGGLRWPNLRRRACVALPLCAALVALLAAAPSAQATFHLMLVREIYPGPAAAPESSYVELQMYASGQELVGGHKAILKNATGATIAEPSFASNLAAGSVSQQTILIGDTGVNAAFGVTPDLTSASFNVPAAGGGDVEARTGQIGRHAERRVHAGVPDEDRLLTDAARREVGGE